MRCTVHQGKRDCVTLFLSCYPITFICLRIHVPQKDQFSRTKLYNQLNTFLTGTDEVGFWSEMVGIRNQVGNGVFLGTAKNSETGYFIKISILFLFTTLSISLATWHVTRPQGYKENFQDSLNESL